jgi:Putative prokaryotic signal transducing protein
LEELLRTNDIVLISFVETLLREAGIAHLVADQNMSVIEGSLGVLPRRVLVAGGELEAARRLLRDAGIEAELKHAKRK